MRRKEKLRLDEDFFDYVFDHSPVIYIAFFDGDFPYCLPFNFYKDKSSIYIHCALDGHKLECIKQNPRVGFSLACEIEIDTRKSTTRYKSLCGKALACLVVDENEKRQALDQLAIRYNALCVRPAPPAAIQRTNIVRFDIIEISGKNSA